MNSIKYEILKKYGKRAVSFLTGVTLLADSMYSVGFMGVFRIPATITAAADETVSNYQASQAASYFSDPQNLIFANTSDGKTRFVDYCYYFCTNAEYGDNKHFADEHKNDDLKIIFTDLNNADFMGLGNSSIPFAGSLKFIAGSSGRSNISLPRALFSYVDTDAKILDNDNKPITLEITRNSAGSSPLFADNVSPGSSAANWKIEVPGGNTNDFAGVFGQLEEDAEVSLEFKNGSSASISNTASGDNDIKDVGELCGVMRAGSELTVTDSSSSRPAVSSDNGNAGGLVGKMEGDASLTLSAYPSFSDVSVTSKNGYAGGLVGETSSDAAITGLASPLAIGGTVTGTTGAGGLYGHYVNTASAFDLKDYNITASVYGQSCGGVFGVLDNDQATSGTAVSLTIKNTGNAGTVDVSSGTHTAAFDYSATGFFGGIAGKYTTDNLKNSLILDNFSVTATAADQFASFGGAIGCADSAAYIKADDLVVTAGGTDQRASSGYFGGVIGQTGGSGVFLDLASFTLTLKNTDTGGFNGGGAVGCFNSGVLRFSGITDMSGAKSQNGGQLVGENNNVLVYAVGSGTNGVQSARSNGEVTTVASGWTFKRSSGSETDDLGTWGEVVRIADIEDSTNGIVTLDPTNHTVTVKAAKTSMATPADFVKTALNIQLNQGSDYDCLKFMSGNNTRTYLLGTTLSITAATSISLSGTGITGFMRDGSDSIGEFTGTLNGNSKTVTLATGEAYGCTSSGGAVSSSSEGVGQIYRHPYNGLFAVIGNGTTGTGIVNDLTIAGSIDVHNKIDGMNIGGIAAVSKGNTTLNGITASQTVNYKETVSVTGTEAAGKNIGGLIGLASGADNGTIAIMGTNTISTAFSISDNYKSWNSLGAFIGKVTSAKFTINIAQGSSDTLTVSHTMTDSGFTAGSNADGGGLIGYITSGTYSDRKVNIKNLDFNGCKIVNKASTNAGGFLGYAWFDTDTKIEGLTVTDGTITNSSPNVGVMCYEATGRWIVNDLTVTKMSLNGGAGTSLGMLVNKAYNGSKGLYLDVLKSGYTLTKKSGTTGVTLPDTLNLYDELAVYSAKNVIKGTYTESSNTYGAGVISINMNADRSGTKTKIRDYDSSTSTENGTGTYQDQLDSNSSTALGAAKYANPNSRYYYNLDKMSTSDKAQDIMLWSVKKYAASNISGLFSCSATPFVSESATDVKLSSYSYYPVYDLSDDLTLEKVNIDLGYSGIYAVEGNSTLDTDSYNRDPGEQNQHYLMQSGLFINGAEGKTLTLKTVQLSGDFLENSTYQGVLFSGTTKGSISVDGLVLDGITPKYNNSGTIAIYSSGYLLVNNVNRADSFKANIQLTLKNVSTSNKYTVSGATANVSKSLFGDVYGPSIGINLSEIKLDARSSSSALSGNDEAAALLDTAYGTVNSIFTTATLFNSLKTSQTANMIYNYSWEDDWINDREVTYGKEVSESVEYADKENKYYNSSKYTDPTTDAHTSEPEYDFSSNWLPYVATAYTANQTLDAQGCFYRELKVNVPATAYPAGCGTYNDPYVIDSGAKLTAIAALINDSASASGLPSIQLPKTLYDGVARNATGDRWCEDKTDHAIYNYNNSTQKYTSSETGVTAVWTVDNVRLYLANAYYILSASNDNTSGNIVLESGYLGLGKKDDTSTTGKYAFRGVIVGDGKVIVNNSPNPLVNVSNGCVIKDVTVNQNDDVSLTAQNKIGNDDAYFGYNSQCQYYGGMIGEIMGGDNIIDNSYVTFGSHTVTLTGQKKNNNTVLADSGLIVPVGSYVGVVVFGGLIFKNIDARKTTLEHTGLKVYYDNNTGNNLAADTTAAKTAIYVNPLVGRVINGYAVNETGGSAKNASGAVVQQFSVTENNHYHDDDNTARTGIEHTLKNGTKHYSIADIDPSLAKLNVTPTTGTGANQNGAINVPNAQALFILSLITQSCAGTAQTGDGEYYNKIGNTEYLSLSYGTVDDNVYGSSHNGIYNSVGTSTTDRTAVSDFNSFANRDTAANTAIPYIIRYYTNGTYSTDNTPQTKTTKAKFEDDINGEWLLISHLTNDGYYLDTTARYNNRRFKATTNLSDATEIHFIYDTTVEAYKLAYDNDTKYLKLDDWNAAQGQGKLIESSTPSYFDVSQYTDSGKKIWLIKDHEKNYWINLKTSEGFAGYKGGKDDAGNRLILYKRNTYISYATFNDSYPARCVTSSLGYYDISLTGSGTYQLPDSFRGLGCVGNYNEAYCMKVDQFAGAGCTIDEDIYLSKYQTDNYFNKIHNGTTQAVQSGVGDYSVNNQTLNHGIGLFDAVKTKDINSAISNFTLTGSVNTEIYDNLYKTSSQELSLYNSANAKWLSVGGVVGTGVNGSNIIFNGITLDGLSVCGSCAVGGIMGYSSNKGAYDISIVSCRTDNTNGLSVKMNSGSEMESNSNDASKARNAIGGFVGKCFEGKVNIYGTAAKENNTDPDAVSTVRLASFGFESSTTVTNYKCCAGGLVGFAGDGCQAYDMYVVSNDSSLPVTVGGSKISYAGGICGGMQSRDDGTDSKNQPYTPTCYANFKNCTVDNINVEGQMVGGLYGGKWGTTGWTPYSITIDNCKVKGNSTTPNTIQASKVCDNNIYAGGFIGRGLVLTNGDPNILIKDSTISDYNITGKYCGGFIGYAGSYANNTTITCYIHDSSVEDCVIGESGNNAGGAVGHVQPKDSSASAANANKMLGYNIKLDDVTLSGTNNGAWIGYLDSGKTSIQFTGIGIYGHGFSDNVGGGASLDTVSFVFADYDGECKLVDDDETPDVSDYNRFTGETDSNVDMPKYPYVNIFPQSSMGTGEIISGDGAFLLGSASETAEYSGKTAEKTMALKIYEDTLLTDQSADNYSRRYTTFKTYNDTSGVIFDGNKIDHYMKRTVTDDGDRVSNYYDEKGITAASAPGYDNFACIVIANNNTDETTALINRYAQLVTNTSTDYAGTDASNDYFDIVVRSCKLQGGKFVVDANANAGLDYSNGQFSLSSHADSLSTTADTFTLVDVQFKDPLHTNKIAYHLYIPVYTIKEIEITFSAAVMDGSNSVSYDTPAGTENTNEYQQKLSKIGSDTHIDNLETWFTTYLRYTYSKNDLQALLDSGNLNWSYNKFVYLDKTQHNATSMLPTNTYMVLVDPNGDHDREYHVSLNSTDFAVVNNRITLDLSKFLRGNDNFSVSTFNELIAKKIQVVPATAEAPGMYDLYSGEGDPANTGSTHYVYTIAADGTKTYYEYVGNGGTWALTLPDGDIYENYYISMYVPKPSSGDPLYGYYIRTPAKFDAPSYASGTNNAITKSAKISCIYEPSGDRQVYIGNLFDQDTEISVLPDDFEIDTGNKTLNIYAQTTITPKNTDAVAILNSVNAAVYHSFNVILDRCGEDGEMSNKIYGLENNGTDIQAWYSLGTMIPQDPDANMVDFTPINRSSIDLQQNYINVETVDNGSVIGSSESITIYSRIRLDFSAAGLENEFPRKVTNNTGVSVRAASNLAYDTTNLAFSSMTESLVEPPETKHVFYRQSLDSASLNYYAKTELDCFDTDGSPSENYSRLGVSGKYSMNGYMPIDSIAQYNVQNIEGAAAGARSIALTVSLQKKTDLPAEGSYTKAEYRNVSSLNDYWGAVVRDAATHEVKPNTMTGEPVTDANKTNLRIKCGSYDQIIAIPTNTSSSFTFSIPKEAKSNGAVTVPGFLIDENGYIFVDIGFCPKTGSGFAEYANYKVNLSVKLLDGDNNDISGSYADNYLIYTNAKVNHDFLSIN